MSMKDKREQAIDLFKKSQFDSAISLFLDVVKTDSNDFSAFYMLGQCYKFNRQLTEAIESLEKSVQVMNKVGTDNDMKGSIYLALGIAYQNSQEFKKAIVTLQKGIGCNPKSFALHNSLGLTYKMIENYKESVLSYYRAREIILKNASYTKNVKLEDGTESLHLEMDKTYFKLQSSPEYCIVMNNIGTVYLEAGDLESAEKAFKESIEFIPQGYNYPPPTEAIDYINSIKNDIKK